MGKLLKYDFKYVLKYWWVALAVLFVSAVIGGISEGKEELYWLQDADLYSSLEANEILSELRSLSVVFFYLALIGFISFSVIIIIMRYYKNLYTDEGYLTFTLPVKENDILLSKFFNALIWAVFTGIAAFLCFMVERLIYNGIISDIDGFWDSFSLFFGEFLNVHGLLAALTVFSQLCFNIILVYVAITVGSIIATKHKLWASVGVYFATNIVLTIVFTILFNVVTFNEAIWSPESFGLESLDTLLIVCFVIDAVLFVGGYILNLRFMKKRLNLA
ncbi:MAG: hypothetical protein MJ145_03520 [Clostridia bacterium]|nr:hypothetical protein [Clostridia bacterium]